MTLYAKAIMHTCYFGTDAAETHECQLRTETNGDIVVSYEADGEHIIYKGSEQSEGHYLLEGENIDGRATLHGFAGSKILEGYWEENGLKGMWRIELDEVSDTLTGDAEEPTFGEETSLSPRHKKRLRDLEMAETLKEDIWETVSCDYRYPLRAEYAVELRLPDDMNRKEARRLGRFIVALAYD